MQDILPKITHENVILRAKTTKSLFKTYEEKRDSEKLLTIILMDISNHVCSPFSPSIKYDVIHAKCPFANIDYVIAYLRKERNFDVDIQYLHIGYCFCSIVETCNNPGCLKIININNDWYPE